MGIRVTSSLTLAALFALATPAVAQPDAQAEPTARADSEFARFVPRPSGKETRLEYAIWNDALGYMVMRMGRSTRQGASRPDPSIGTRKVYGHDSRIRLEGNRIVFEFLDPEVVAPLTEYRKDLEQIGGQIDIASLPRNEQLAFWINLHNVAVTEQIALAYPVQSPSRMKLGPQGTPLDTTRFINVGGVAMSPHDIRTKIVFPNWSDPRVIYGFFRGEIGGPSIQREAFTGDTVSTMLGDSANEFVNSLRGVEGYGDSLLVSKIYQEAAPFYFPQMGADLRAHLASFADDDVKKLLAEKSQVKINQYVDTVADLAGGEREPEYNYVEKGELAVGMPVSASILRMLRERSEKFREMRKDGLLFGRVIILPSSATEEQVAPAEVE